ncbi:helix-turn-helix domain-containing protein [Dickeya sp. ws52]|nr:YdaS family helix-turn-helix protein [Dickeya sp. ws52]TYL43924.1 helix-turn-helix domain-containing protein [Dickeya sp. ws52]
MSVDIKRLVMSIASQSEIARILNCRQQTVSLWLNGKVPDGRVIQLARAIGWRVTPHQLRPDIYPGELDGIPNDIRVNFNSIAGE